MFIRFSRKLRALVGVTALAGVASIASATTVYTAATPRYYLPSDTNPLYYNVGPDSGPSRILFDDLPVLLGSEINPSINVTQVSFDISRKPNAAATSINAYWAPLVLDNALIGGPGDGPNDDPSSPVLIGSVNLPQNGAAHTRTTISFGDGASLLFNTGPLNLAQAPGWGIVALGLEFSDVSTDQGWTVGVHPDNSDLLWDYASNISFDEFTYGVDGNGQFIIGTQLLTVVGSVVPEPASTMIFAGIGAAIGVLRPRGRFHR